MADKNTETTHDTDLVCIDKALAVYLVSFLCETRKHPMVETREQRVRMSKALIALNSAIKRDDTCELPTFV